MNIVLDNNVLVSAIWSPGITGNRKHYPNEPDIMAMAEFCQKYL